MLWVVSTAATVWVRPEALAGLAARPWAFGFVAMSAGGLWGTYRFPGRGRELAAFLSSSAFLLGMVATALAGNYPYWLRSTLDPAYSLTASNALSGRYGMGVALTWWTLGILLTTGYFIYLFRRCEGRSGRTRRPVIELATPSLRSGSREVLRRLAPAVTGVHAVRAGPRAYLKIDRSVLKNIPTHKTPVVPGGSEAVGGPHDPGHSFQDPSSLE